MKATVKCNFESVFARYNSVDELKDIANNICGQVKEAFDARVKEIKSGNNEVKVEVEVETGNAPKPEEKPKSGKAKGNKITGAKEMAEKFKKQEKGQKSEAKNEPKAEKDNDTLIAVSDVEAIKKLGLKFEKYNDKCWVLRGETKPLRKVLKEQFKGVYNSHLNGGDGWVFRNANAQECANALGLNVKVA